MTCKDCIHRGLCYKENDYENFPDRCGDFISNKIIKVIPQSEWKAIGGNIPDIWQLFCPKCKCAMSTEFISYCSNCGWRADMRGDKE